MNVNGHIGKLGPQGAHEHLGRAGGEQTGHILDGKGMDAHVGQFTGEIDVIFEIVLALGGVGDISRVADGALDESTGGTGGVDSELEIVEIIERIKDAEDVDSGFGRLLAEFVHDIVGIVGISHRVGATEQHLEGHVRHLFPQFLQSLPRTFVQESHGHVERRSSPHLHAEHLGQSLVGVLGARHQFLGPHAGGEEGLMSVSPGGIHEKQARVIADILGVSFGSVLEENLSVGTFPLLLFLGLELGKGDLGMSLADGINLGNVSSQLDGMTVHGDVGQISQGLLEVHELLLTRLTLGREVPLGARDLLQARVLVDETGSDDAFFEGGVGEHVQ
mmetsp:Transcript_18872/g.54649  ORF Transcript_18872/g.54649 Transcript_18872/m.54649 type:complete len:333 (-) Transcript_18872:914-1912(-)